MASVCGGCFLHKKEVDFYVTEQLEISQGGHLLCRHGAAYRLGTGRETPCGSSAEQHYPKTKEGWDELGKRVATAHANYVIEKIDRLNCPTWQKLELLQAVIDTTKGTYKPKEHQKPGWQPSR